MTFTKDQIEAVAEIVKEAEARFVQMASFTKNQPAKWGVYDTVKELRVSTHYSRAEMETSLRLDRSEFILSRLTAAAETSKEMVEAVAESWASIDGKLERFREDKTGSLGQMDGCYDGYMIEAKELLVRAERRGYAIDRVSVSVEGWRDISSAPKDGTHIIVFRPNALQGDKYIPRVGVDRWTEISGRGVWGKSNTETQPTHWRELPAAPRLEDGK